MMFASLTLSGKLKSECNPSLDPNTGQPRTLGSLLPANCESIGGSNPTGASLAQGFCHGLKGDNCETLLGGDLLSTPLEQGICHGLQGDDCDAIPAGFNANAMPNDCETLTIGNQDSDDEGRASLIAQGRCYGRKPATDCDALPAEGTSGGNGHQGRCLPRPEGQRLRRPDQSPEERQGRHLRGRAGHRLRRRSVPAALALHREPDPGQHHRRPAQGRRAAGLQDHPVAGRARRPAPALLRAPGPAAAFPDPRRARHVARGGRPAPERPVHGHRGGP